MGKPTWILPASIGLIFTVPPASHSRLRSIYDLSTSTRRANIIPTGTNDDTNTSFELPVVPYVDTLQLFVGKLLMEGGVIADGADYSLSGTTITLAVPAMGQSMRAFFDTEVSSTKSNVIPTGTNDDTNLVFTLPTTPVAGTLRLFVGKVLFTEGPNYDLSGTTITLAVPAMGQSMRAFYNETSDATREMNDVPIGAVDGDNAIFNLSKPPVESSLQVFVAGLYQDPATDFELNSASWSTLPVARRFGGATAGVENSGIVHESYRGVMRVYPLFDREALEFTFRVTQTQLESFRALHDVVIGNTRPFFFRPDGTSSNTLLVRKEAGFAPQEMATAADEPMYDYILKLREEIVAVSVTV